MSGAPIRVVHVITGLSTGGAEMMLTKLVTGSRSDRFEHVVISMLDRGDLGDRLEAAGIRVLTLDMARGRAGLKPLLKLSGHLRALRPAVVQSWMYHADLAAGLAGLLAGRPPLAWGIRHSNLDARHSKRSTIAISRLLARLSRWLPTRIVCCSEAAQKVHGAIGYDRRKMLVVPNGFDLGAFRPDPAARLAVRAELGLPAATRLVGLVGRFDSQKDHRSFVQAAGIAAERHPDVHFVLCGTKVDADNAALAAWIVQTERPERFHLLGRRDDMPRLTAAFDVACSSSITEGFPNVLGEAMACGVPCVVTDVGDSAHIVGDSGRVVPAGEPAALGAALSDVLALAAPAYQDLAERALARVRAHFDLTLIVDRYEQLYAELATGRPDPATKPSAP